MYKFSKSHVAVERERVSRARIRMSAEKMPSFSFSALTLVLNPQKREVA
jgi:hypothetical protein